MFWGEFRDLRVAVWFLFELIPGSDTGNQGGFRVLRDTTQGSALRTRKPFEKGLSESFNMGAVLCLMPLQ